MAFGKVGGNRGEHKDKQETEISGLRGLRETMDISDEDLYRVYMSYMSDVRTGKLNIYEWISHWMTEDSNGVNLMTYLIVFSMELIDSGIEQQFKEMKGVIH